MVFENQQIQRFEMKPEEYFNKDVKKEVNHEEALLIIENKIAMILGELSIIDQKDPKYRVLDQEFKELLKQKKELIG